jgi:AraC-like DNA-binding protein
MGTLFQASDEPAVSREERWRHVLGEAVGGIETRGVPERFVFGQIGALRVGELSSVQRGGGKRTTAHIRSSNPDLCKIDVLASGRGVVEQGGREAELGPGDFTLVDMTRPATWATEEYACMVAVVFPAAMLPFDRDRLSCLTAVEIQDAQGPGAIVSSLARDLPGQLDSFGAGDGARLGTAVTDLLAATLAARLDDGERVPLESRQRALLLQIHAFLEERLGDPELAPSLVADAHYISVRYLHRLFESEETTVADWIRTRRLERCRHDLLDPALRGRRVGAVGARWGFADPAHFSRAFRAAYGVPPGEFRATFGSPSASPVEPGAAREPRASRG